MLNRSHISVLVALTVVVWVMTLVVRGTPLTLDLLLPFGAAVSTLVAATLLFDKYAWRWPWLQTLLSKRPDLQGTWRARLVSNFVVPETGATIAPIMGYIVIRQTFSRLSARLYTDKGSSSLVAHAIEMIDGDRFRITAVYQNVPRLDLRGNGSEIHHGTFIIEAQGFLPTVMDGHYWTDRNTRGTLTLADRTSSLASDLTSAALLFPSLH